MPAEENLDSNAIRFLKKSGVDFRLFQHHGPIHSLEEAAAERNQTPDQVARSLLFRLAEDEYLMILASGPAQIDWRSLRQTLGLSRLTMATREEVLEKTGSLPGTVSPFCIDPQVRIRVDEDIFQQSEISLGSGISGVGIILTPQVLMQVLGNPEKIRLAKQFS